MTRDVIAIGIGIIGVVIAFTILSGGTFHIGTASTGPYATFGFRGPQYQGQ